MPFRVTIDTAADNSKPAAMYARGASRRDGVRASEYDSYRVDGVACSTASIRGSRPAPICAPARAWETQAFVMQTWPQGAVPAATNSR